MKALLMNPWAWLALIAGLTFSTGLGGVIGYRQATIVAQGLASDAALTVSNDKLTAAAALATAYGRVRATEIKWRGSLEDITKLHHKEMTDANLKIKTLQSDVRSGAVRLSIGAKVPACPAVGAAGASPGPAASAGAEGRAELSADAAEFLVGFAGSCDATARQLNAVIDAYQAIRARPIDSKD